MDSQALSITNITVGITCLISFILMQNRAGMARLLFHPVTIRQNHQWYRFLTSGFVHADMVHLLVNMFVLWSFGNAIERSYYPAFLGDFTAQKFMLLYFGGIVAASVPDFVRYNRNANYAALGASGGVSAVVFAAILFEPWQNLYLYGVIGIPQILAGAAYLYYSWYQDRRAKDNIAHMAHFAGAVWGFVITGLMNPALFARFIEKALQGPSWL
ncbi:MAG: rhomboid family intramembrane serine protease [Woeseiaceae bacterium]|nr:rhomboid family intramembrane serine protease [Woeseiaceae bacterium]